MIDRSLAPKIQQLATKFPVVALTGPRQSGKSTLLKYLFPIYKYVSLEDPASGLSDTPADRLAVIYGGESSFQTSAGSVISLPNNYDI